MSAASDPALPAHTGAQRAEWYWAAGGQTAGEQTSWKAALAARYRGTGTVLDVGCGQGASSLPGAVGLDGSAQALLAAADRGLLPVRADLERRWPIADGSVGTVLLFDVLEHVPDPRPLLAEADRVLAADGTLLVAVPNAAHLVNRVNALRGRTTDFTDAAHQRDDPVSDHLHRLTVASARQLLEGSGFDVVARHDFFPSAFTEGGWRWVSPLARFLRACGAVDRWPGALAYEFAFACRRARPARTAPPLRAVPDPVAPPHLPNGPAGGGAGGGLADDGTNGADMHTPAPRSGTAAPAGPAGSWGDDDPRYRGYMPTRRGVRLDHRVRVALALLEPRPGGRLVDVGGGDGWVTGAAAVRTGAGEATVVDVAFAPPLAPRPRPVRQVSVPAGGALPFADATVDTVVCLETIEHVADPDALLAELFRVLVPGGQLVLSTPRLDAGIIIAALVLGVQPPGVDASVHRRYGTPLGEGRPSGHLHLFTRRALAEAMAFHGFRVERYREGRFSSSWRQARRAARRLALKDLPVELAFSVYDLLPFRKDVQVLRAVRP